MMDPTLKVDPINVKTRSFLCGGKAVAERWGVSVLLPRIDGRVLDARNLRLDDQRTQCDTKLRFL